MFLSHLKVGEVLAYSSVDLVKDTQFDRGFLIDLDVLGGGDSPVESACENGEVSPLLFTGYQFIENLGEGLGVL